MSLLTPKRSLPQVPTLRKPGRPRAGFGRGVQPPEPVDAEKWARAICGKTLWTVATREQKNLAVAILNGSDAVGKKIVPPGPCLADLTAKFAELAPTPEPEPQPQPKKPSKPTGEKAVQEKRLRGQASDLDRLYKAGWDLGYDLEMAAAPKHLTADERRAWEAGYDAGEQERSDEIDARLQYESPWYSDPDPDDEAHNVSGAAYGHAG